MIKEPPIELPPVKRAPDVKPRKTTFTIADGEWDGKPCYIITETAEQADCKFVYYIGKEDNFIYSDKLFEIASCKLLSSSSYTNVILNPDLPDDLFMLPENAVIKTPANSQEETRMISGAIIAMHSIPANLDDVKLDKPVPLNKIIYIVATVFVALGLILATVIIIRRSRLSNAR